MLARFHLLNNLTCTEETMDVVEIVAAEPSEIDQELAEPPSLSPHPEDLELGLWAHRKKFMSTHFPGAVQKDWDSWRWQLKHRVTSVEAMARILGVPVPAFEKTRRQLPVAATPYYLWVASRSEALRRCILPDVRETLSLPFETPDPLGEEGHSPVPGHGVLLDLLPLLHALTPGGQGRTPIGHAQLAGRPGLYPRASRGARRTSFRR
jgi:hypothetical protein